MKRGRTRLGMNVELRGYFECRSARVQMCACSVVGSGVRRVGWGFVRCFWLEIVRQWFWANRRTVEIPGDAAGVSGCVILLELGGETSGAF